ncbi:hypothetical protein GCM10027168_70550 [Streptomyces capparidis]
MRRKGALVLALWGMLVTSVLATPATAAQREAPGVWRIVDGDEPARPSHPRAVSSASAAERVSLRSGRNNNYVTTELDYASPHTGALRARSATVAGWESFELVWDEGTETHSLKSTANNLYVAVERNYTGDSQNVLRARSATVGSWERFTLWRNQQNNAYALQSELNGLFVTMENDYTADLQYVLRARSNGIGGSWEEFYLQN